VNKDNEALAQKLQEAEKNLYYINLEKKELELRLNNKAQELDDARKRFEREQEDKNKRINGLHQEIKELQDKLADNNSRNNLLDGKNKDLVNSFERMTTENRDCINKYRSENEKLNHQNMDLISKASKLSNELDALRSQSDKLQ